MNDCETKRPFWDLAIRGDKTPFKRAPDGVSDRFLCNSVFHQQPQTKDEA